MSRALLILANEEVRKRAHAWVAKAPIGYRIEFKEPRRSTDQNAYLWALLTDVAAQKTHMGQKYSTEIWKCLFMAAMGQEIKFIPALDGVGVLPLGLSSSDLSKKEMADLITFIISWGVSSGVKFHDQKSEAA